MMLETSLAGLFRVIFKTKVLTRLLIYQPKLNKSMLKTAFCGWATHGGTRPVIKSLLLMKLPVFFLTVAFLHVSTKGVSQNVTFSGKNVSLESVFPVVEQQTGYLFLYQESDLSRAKPVTVQAIKKPLLQFLEDIFRNQPVKYLIKSKTISISPAADTALPHLLSNNSLHLIHGVVHNEKGEAIAGASIVVKGIKSGVSAGADGAFNIYVEQGNTLLITSIGYEPAEYKITPAVAASFDQSSTRALTINLKHVVSKLGEVEVVVNTGYQRIRPEQSTGAVSQISTKEYESRISTNFIDGLVNRLPGLMINNNVNFVSNGGASSRSLFNIRGISTMSANQNPLIVVDGYPTELTIDMIDPNEIKSVTILKDAAAATVYGVRASNGVIVIERKQASQGKPRFAFRATAGITPKEDYSRYRWADNASSIVTNYEKNIYSTSINNGTWGQLATASAGTVARPKTYYILAQAAAKMITPDQTTSAFADLENYDNAADYRRLFLRPALTQTYNFNVSGGTGNALYYITANYTRNRLSEIKNDNDRMLLSGRTTLKLSRRLSLELTTDYQEQNLKTAPVPDLNAVSPYEHFQDVNGNPSFVTGKGISPSYNDVLMSHGLSDMLQYPLIDVNEINSKKHTVNNRITANFNYVIGAGFDLSFGGIYETSRSDLREYDTEQSSVARGYINSYVSLNTDGTLKYNIPKGGFLRQQTDNTSSYTARAQLNYNKRINGLHSINAILGAEMRSVISKGNMASYFGYNDETLQQQPVDYAAITTAAIRGAFQLGSPLQNQYPDYFGQQYTEDRFLSGYTNIVYAFKNTYSVTGSMRIDQSNLFGTNPKYKYKPLWSVGAAWNIDQENFMEEVNWVKQLKLRLAYGFNGNVAKMSLPQVIAESTLNTYTSPSSPSLRLLAYANSSLRWEQTNSFNLGLDYHIFKHITGTVDYYKKKSTDLLGDAQIDPTIGTSPSLINRATINNNGVEVSLHADWIATKNLNWNTGFVISRNTSKVLDVYQKTDFSPQTLNSLGYVKGYPVGAMFAYRYAGLDTAGYPLIENTNGKTYRTNDSRSGSPTGDLMASDTSGVSRYMGSSIPTINAGLSNRVDIGNFYIFCMINYYGGFKVRVPRPNPSVNRPLEGAESYWKKKGDEQTTDVMGLAAFSSAYSNNAYNFADKYVVNGDYITLGDLTVSYSLDNSRFIKRAGFTHFEIKCQASNIWTVGLNSYNYSMATNGYQKSYITPSYTFAVFANF